MYLLDTNIWLERLLAQEHSEAVGELLGRLESDQLFLTDFSFHSICLILTRLNRPQSVIEFIQDLFIEGSVGLLSVPPEGVESVIGLMKKFNLDFDDAYQYFVAERDNLVLVSFDTEFVNTTRGRKTPMEVLERS